MFRRNDKARPETVRKEPFTYIHRGTTLIGQLRGEGRVRVHGHVKGNVKVDGVLEVSQAGVIEGELVEADEVKILGHVRADVVAGGKVEIWSGGELVGNVRAASLDIEEGAYFTGTSEMLGPDGTPRASLASQPLAALAVGEAAVPAEQGRQLARELGAAGVGSGERPGDEVVMTVSQSNGAESSEI